ncbi:hypothetical protein GCM10025876_11640 [Demequina litorisediminis]|uniref:hydrogen peroxide-dependent heme synthase n=1 Tax=Demequina litorisediminis TaxID=1849022 RepID=A0ABQ6IAZ7_9MICO|nr:hypothetical protein GCM10025876_11640 [Demequina litorisediminis]
MTEQPHGFTLFSVLDGFLDAPDEELGEVVEHFDAAVEELAEHDVVLRGIYDVSGLRADGTVMLWLHGPDLADLQLALRELRATEPARRHQGSRGLPRACTAPPSSTVPTCPASCAASVPATG